MDVIIFLCGIIVGGLVGRLTARSEPTPYPLHEPVVVLKEEVIIIEPASVMPLYAGDVTTMDAVVAPLYQDSVKDKVTPKVKIATADKVSPVKIKAYVSKVENRVKKNRVKKNRDKKTSDQAIKVMIKSVAKPKTKPPKSRTVK